MIKKLPIERDALIVLSEKDLAMQKSARNIPTVKLILAGYLNIRDLQAYKNIVILKDAVAKIKETFLTKTK